MRTDVPLDIEAVFKPRVPKVAGTFMEDEMNEEPEPKKTVEDPPAPPPLPRSGPAATEAQTVHTIEEAEKAGLLPPVETPSSVAVEASPAPAEWERGLEPRTMNEACLLAKRMHESRMFSAYGTPQAVLSTVLLGRELGMPAMASLRSVHVIEGKHSLSADLMVALVLKSGLAEYFQMLESTDT